MKYVGTETPETKVTTEVPGRGRSAPCGPLDASLGPTAKSKAGRGREIPRRPLEMEVPRNMSAEPGRCVAMSKHVDVKYENEGPNMTACFCRTRSF